MTDTIRALIQTAPDSIMGLDKVYELCELGELGFIEYELKRDNIRQLWETAEQNVAIWMLLCLDKLSKKHNIPLEPRYDDIRVLRKANEQ